jgi:hypothetical protein
VVKCGACGERCNWRAPRRKCGQALDACYIHSSTVSRAGTEYSTAYRLQHSTTGWIRLVTEGVPEHSNDTGATRIEAVDDTWI